MNIQLIIEVLGTVAFAISGAMLAIDRKMDLFGVLFLGLVTASGGGFIRDVVLGDCASVHVRKPHADSGGTAGILLYLSRRSLEPSYDSVSSGGKVSVDSEFYGCSGAWAFHGAGRECGD